MDSSLGYEVGPRVDGPGSVKFNHEGKGAGEAGVLADLLRSQRDWRVDTTNPEKSVVFMSGVRAGAQLSPVSGESAVGRQFLAVFYALAAAIESYRRNYMVAAGRIDPNAEPRSFAVIVQGVRCRIQRVQETRYHVRVPSELLELKSLGMPESLHKRLMGPELDQGGLVVVCGSYGSGKTSTVNAVVRERIERKGGYALVMGNPIEYLYSGFHGSNAQPGYVEQVDLVGLNLAAEIKASMRNFPAGAVSILAYPELIGADGVGEMLRAANRGNLVFADMHALNIEASMINLVSMATIDGEGYARELLGNSLRMVIHQKMTAMPNSKSGMSVIYDSIFVNKTMRAALIDSNVTLSKAINSVLNTPERN